MTVTVQERIRELARRAGVSDVRPSVLAGVAVLAVLAACWTAWAWWPDRSEPAPVRVDAAREAPCATAPAAAEPTAAPVMVHVVGAVRHPGVYELVAGARAIDAVNAAGGLIGDAAPEGLNLARQVMDGEQVLVPRQGETCAAPPPMAPGAAGSGGAAAAAGTPVNINTADAALLDTLPGVGPSTAAKIIADREANGPFASPEDLGRVSGIGPKKLDALSGLICVR